VIDQRLANHVWCRVLRFTDRQPDRRHGWGWHANQERAEPIERVGLQAREQRIQNS
jgi:hypothetical protein